MNKFIENLAKLFNKATSFLVTKRTMQLPLVNLDPREHLPTVRILRPEEEVNRQSNIKHKQATRVKEMKNEQRNFFQMMDCPYPTILSQIQMPLGQPLDQEKNLERPCMDPFKVPDLDDSYEQKKLNKDSSSQLNDIESQLMHNSLEQRLKAVEDRNILEGINLDELNQVSDLVIPPNCF